MIVIIDMAVSFLQMFLQKNGPNLPSEVVAAVQAAVDALFKHQNDLVTKANLEALRG